MLRFLFHIDVGVLYKDVRRGVTANVTIARRKPENGEP
jgi:hypothetical protein